MSWETIDSVHGAAKGYVLPLESCNLVFITKGNSVLGCGALDVAALDRLQVPAARISGVASVQDLLDGVVKEVNAGAAGRGVQVGDSGRDALDKL